MQRESEFGSINVNAYQNGRSKDVWEAALTLFAERGYRGTTMRDIGGAMGIKGPSLYNHVGSKQQLLQDIMSSTMERALSSQCAALEASDDVAEQLRLMTEAHARLPARHRREVLITNREVPSLDPEQRKLIEPMRVDYERGFREVIQRGCEQSKFLPDSPRLTSFAILEMTNGLAMWFRRGGEMSEDEVIACYGAFALRLVGARERS